MKHVASTFSRLENLHITSKDLPGMEAFLSDGTAFPALKNLHLHATTSSFEGFGGIPKDMSSFPRVESLQFSGYITALPLGFHYLSNLHTLSLDRVCLASPALPDMRETLSTLPLISLTLKFVFTNSPQSSTRKLSSADTFNWVDADSGFDFLTYLNISYIGSVACDGQLSPFYFARHLHQLQYLYTDLSEANSSFIRRLSECESLKHLSITYRESARQGENVPSCIQSFSQLESLSLEMGYNRKLLFYTVECPLWWRKLKRLRHLHLVDSAMNISRSAMESICCLHELRSLHIEAQGVVEIPQSIGDLGNLSYLSLPETSLVRNAPMTLRNLKRLKSFTPEPLLRHATGDGSELDVFPLLYERPAQYLMALYRVPRRSFIVVSSLSAKYEKWLLDVFRELLQGKTTLSNLPCPPCSDPLPFKWARDGSRLIPIIISRCFKPQATDGVEFSTSDYVQLLKICLRHCPREYVDADSLLACATKSWSDALYLPQKN